jgi:hypothetical protein
MDELWWWISFRCGVDGFDGWPLCLAMNASLFGVGSFIELIGFDLGKAAAQRTGAWNGRGLLVPMPVKVPRTASLCLVNFVVLLTQFSSVIAGPFVIMMRFSARHSKIEDIAHICIN